MKTRRLLIQATKHGCWLSALGLILTAGCGSGGSGTISLLLGFLQSEAVFVNVVTRTGVRVEVDLRADSRSLNLSRCGGLTNSCTTALTPCPERIRLIEARRYNDRGELIGGLDFTSTGGYTYELGTFYNCGDTILLDFTTDIPAVYIPGSQ